MTHWDKFNKATKFEFSLFNMPSASFALQFGDFVPRNRSAAKGPLLYVHEVFYLLCSEERDTAKHTRTGKDCGTALDAKRKPKIRS